MERIRITYTKGPELRYTGNLDVQKIWERTLRRARLPVAFSQGFHPQARINQACPLPLGFTSQGEMIDLWLDTDQPDLSAIKDTLSITVQPGISILAVNIVPQNEPSLPSQVSSAEYTVYLPDGIDLENLQVKISAFFQSTTVVRTKREKTYDIRPLVEKMELVDPSQKPVLKMQLAARGGATGRPDEVLLVLDIDPNGTKIERTKLILG
jgi:radical SAM-linked protein